MEKMYVPYDDQGTHLEAVAISPTAEKRAAVILCHAWAGRDAFIEEKAELIAQMGYTVFALDMYGKGVLGKSREENIRLKQPFVTDRALLQRRVVRGFEEAKKLPSVDAQRIAVIGFGFGGICALDLARSGADVQGAISIYGHFTPPAKNLIKPIRAKILVLHGYNDPVTSQTELRAFEEEMEAAHVDWQVHVYGNTMHAFATPSAQDPASGVLYHPTSAARAWKEVSLFLQEVLFSLNKKI